MQEENNSCVNLVMVKALFKYFYMNNFLKCPNAKKKKDVNPCKNLCLHGHKIISRKPLYT